MRPKLDFIFRASDELYKTKRETYKTQCSPCDPGATYYVYMYLLGLYLCSGLIHTTLTMVLSQLICVPVHTWLRDTYTYTDGGTS